MTERTKSIVKKVAYLLLIVVILFGYYPFKRATQLSLVGGWNEKTAVEICQDDTITVKMIIEKNDRMIGMYAYWDDNKEEKQELEKGLLTAKAEIDVPNTVGIHKLTIETGFLKFKYDYYYEVVKGKSD